MLSAPFPKMFPGRRQKRRVTPFVTEVLMHWSRSNFMVRVSDFTPGDQNFLVFLNVIKCNFLYNSKMQKSMILEMFSSNSQGSLRACLFRLEKKFTLKSISIPWFVSFLKVQIKQGPRRMWGLHFASQKKFSNYLCLIFKS